LRKDVELLCESATLSLLGDRHLHAPYGINGGQPGSLAKTMLVRDGAATELASKAVVPIRKGDVVRFQLAGAGGCGQPEKRKRERIEADVADGYVTAAAARARYG
jgi:N-methylhydantoinase B